MGTERVRPNRTAAAQEKPKLPLANRPKFGKKEPLQIVASGLAVIGRSSMQSVLIVVHLMIIVMLIATVLLQRSEGGALGLGGGGFLTGRGQANALTRATAILAGLFFLTSIGLTLLARYNQGPEVTFQSITPAEPPAGGAGKPAQSKGSILDQLKRLEGGPSAPPALPEGTVPQTMSLPEAGEEAPEQTNSIMQIAPPKGPLPSLKEPATPLATLPAQSGADSAVPLAPAPKPAPFKAAPPASEPWAK
jgi:preprotein translocase subunit SecG